MDKLNIETLVLGNIRTNTYIISNPKTKEAIVIDPADDAGRIHEHMKLNELICRGILLTHGHFDHIMAAEELRSMEDVLIYAHEAEKRLLEDPSVNVSAYAGKGIALQADVLLKRGQVLTLAGMEILVLHTPGHTAGSVCYKINNILISGDTLFYQGIGRTDLPTGDKTQLLMSIIDYLLVLDDDTPVYPGHGRTTTIGYERKNNMYLASGEFV